LPKAPLSLDAPPKNLAVVEAPFIVEGEPSSGSCAIALELKKTVRVNLNKLFNEFFIGS